jgi:hypothetical protein
VYAEHRQASADEASAVGIVAYLVGSYEIDEEDAVWIVRSRLAIVFRAIERGAPTALIGDLLVQSEVLRE